MKKLLLPLVMIFGFIAALNAQEYVTDVFDKTNVEIQGLSSGTVSTRTLASGATYVGKYYAPGSGRIFGINGTCMVNTVSGGTVHKISINLANNVPTANSGQYYNNAGTLDVYGSHEPFASDAPYSYSNLPAGAVKITSFSGKGVKEYNFADDQQYEYLAYIPTQGNPILFVSMEVTWNTTPSDQVSKPRFSLPSGSYLGEQTLEITCNTEEASIYYTLDGSEPSAASTLYTAPITISRGLTVKAIALAEGLSDSDVASADYAIQVFAPEFSVASGDYTRPQLVTITANPADASIYYTLDGTEPTAESTLYTEPVEIATTSVLKAIAIKEGCINSEITSARIAIVPFLWDLVTDNLTYQTLQLPQGIEDIGEKPFDSGAVYGGNMYYSPRFANSMAFNGNGDSNGGLITTTSAGGIKSIEVTFNTGTRVVINNEGAYNDVFFNDREILVYGRTAEEGPYESSADLYDPAKQGTLIGRCGYPEKKLGTQVFTFAPTDVEYAYVGFASSYLVSFAPEIKIEWKKTPHVMTPEFTPAPGEYDDTQYVTITCDTPDATIYYTLDGSDPTEESPVYDGEIIEVTQTKTIKAMAVDGISLPSYIAVGEYIIRRVVKFSKVLSLDQLRSGSKVIVAAAGTDMALSTTQYSNNRGLAEITLSDDAAQIIEPSAAVQILTLVQQGDSWLIKAGADGYLTAQSSKNYLMTTSSVTSDCYVSLTPAEDGTVDICFTEADRYLRYNEDLEVFATYAEGRQLPVVMYVENHTGDPSFVAAPVLSVISGKYEEPFLLSMTCATEGADIYYTLDGENPTAGSTLYEGPVTISESATVKAIAIIGEYSSEIAEESYVIQIQSGIESVSVNSTDSDAVYYTLQGVRVERPAKGSIVVEVRNGKATKTVK